MRVRVLPPPPSVIQSVAPRRVVFAGLDGNANFGSFDDFAGSQGFAGFGEMAAIQLNGYAASGGFGDFAGLLTTLDGLDRRPSLAGLDPSLDGLWDTIKKGAKAAGKGIAAGAKGVAKGAVAAGKGIAAGAGAVKSAVGTVVNTALKVVDKVTFGILPSPLDYEPERLIVIGLTDPISFAILGAAINVVMPGLGAAYMAMFSFPAAPVSGFPLAVGKSYAVGGWNRVIKNILDPLANGLKDQAKFLIDYCLNGNSAIARWACKRVARDMTDSVMKGVVWALSESVEIVDAVRSPSKLKDEATWLGLATLMKKLVEGGTFGKGSMAKAVGFCAAIIDAMAGPVSILLKKGVGGLIDAVDGACKKTLGFGPSDLKNLPDIAKREFAKAKTAAGNVLKIDIVDGFAGAMTDITRALRKLPWGVDKLLDGIMKPIQEMVKQIKAFLADAKALAAQLNSGQAPALPVASSPPPPAATPPAPPEATPTPPPAATPPVVPTPQVPPPPPPKAGVAGPLLAGVGAGFVVGGPAGALLGGGVGLVLSQLRKK